jgi:hypothetical protein
MYYYYPILKNIARSKGNIVHRNAHSSSREPLLSKERIDWIYKTIPAHEKVIRDHVFTHNHPEIYVGIVSENMMIITILIMLSKLWKSIQRKDTISGR